MIKAIPEFPNYFIEDSGDVWTNVPHGPKGKNNEHKELRKVKPRPGKTGYMRVYMRHTSGKRKDRYVHRLVAEAFIPKELNKTHIDHLDFNRANNSSTNLRWVTVEENAKRTLEEGHLIRNAKGMFVSNYNPNELR